MYVVPVDSRFAEEKQSVKKRQEEKRYVYSLLSLAANWDFGYGVALYACTKKYAVMPVPIAITNQRTQSLGSRSEYRAPK